MDFQSWLHCPWCGAEWDKPGKQLKTGAIVCGGCGCSFVDWQDRADNLAILVRRLIHPHHDSSVIKHQATDLLQRYGLEGSPLRKSPGQLTPEQKTVTDIMWGPEENHR